MLPLRNSRTPAWPARFLRLDDPRGEGTIVERHEQRLEARRQRVDRGLRRQVAERGELGAPEPAQRNCAGARPGGAAYRCARGCAAAACAAEALLRGAGFDRTRPALADLDLQVVRDGVLRIHLQRGIERCGRLIELPHLHAAPRQPRPRPWFAGTAE